MAEKAASNRTLERAAAILDAVESGPKLATRIAEETGLSLSTTHRLALAMVETGFLSRQMDASFAPGHRVQRPEREARFDYGPMWELSTEVGESVQLWERSGQERICSFSIDAPHELRISLPEGSRLPLPAGSAGGILAGTQEAMDSVRSRGWFQSEGRRSPGVGSVSAPIVVNGRTLGVVCVALPLSRVVRSTGEDYGDAVVRAANKIAAAIPGTKATE